MIRSIWADFDKFKRVDFTDGFNVILAEKTKESKSKDSRNGLGKSSLVEIIHFLLGSTRFANVKDTPLADWTFFGAFVINGSEYVVSRSPKKPSRIRIESGDMRAWESQGYMVERDEAGRYFDSSVWTKVLGSATFGLPVVQEETYAPTFRSLISYFIRLGKDAYSIPFSHHRKQHEWDIQINNAYLLHLDWRDATVAQELRDRGKLAVDLKRASDLGVVRDYFGKRGELEAERGRIKNDLDNVQAELTSFTIAPQYAVIEDNADQLTTEINVLSNENYSAKLILSDYIETLAVEHRVPYIDIERIYQEAGAIFEGEVRRNLDDVRDFHTRLTNNRRSYLEAEILRLRSDIARRDVAIQDMDARRARYLRALEENRALDHYAAMRVQLEELQDRLLAVSTRIRALNDIDSAKAQLKIDNELSRRVTLDHYNERRVERDIAVAYFGEASRHLYEAPGDLIIDVGKTGGYKFNYEIERKRSGGYSSGAVFCYDLTLAQIWANRGLNVLVHDSTLFDPIDERQLAHALELAADRSTRAGFQYICALNTDRVPTSQLREGFDFSKYVILRLTDATDDGGLFGIRF